MLLSVGTTNSPGLSTLRLWLLGHGQTANRRRIMWMLFENILGKLDRWRYRRNLDRALALHWRGEVRRDGLILNKSASVAL
jgi:hypothetical protein